MYLPLAYLGIAIFLCSCYPAHNSYLQEVVLNFSDSRFITADIFQVICNLTREYPEDIQITRKRLLEACRKKLFYELYYYQVHYYLHWRNFLESGKGVFLGEYDIEILDEEYQTLEKEFQDFVPGQIVYEEWDEEQIKAVYRIEQKNLIQKIQDRSLAITPRIIKKS